MNTTQIRKMVNKSQYYVSYWLYQSNVRCHIVTGLDEPECILMALVKYIDKNYEVIGYTSENEAINSLLDECDRLGYLVDPVIPAFEHNIWDGSLRRLFELDQQVPLVNVVRWV